MTTHRGGGSSTPSEAFLRDGAVVIRNALDPETMALLRRVYDFALDNPTHPSPEMLPDADAIKAETDAQKGYEARPAARRSFCGSLIESDRPS